MPSSGSGASFSMTLGPDHPLGKLGVVGGHVLGLGAIRGGVAEQLLSRVAADRNRDAARRPR